MEYRKRRRTKRHRSSEDGGGFIGIIILILVIAGSVYLISTSSAGNWLSKNVFAQMFKSNPNATASLESSSVFSSAKTADRTEQDVSLPGLTAYMLQMGIYKNSDNAETVALTLRDKGAAGYVLSDNEGAFRVIAAAYHDKESAVSVRDRLKTEGMDCTLFELSGDTIVYKVSTDSGDDTQIQSVKTAFASMKTATDDMFLLSVNFDKDSMEIVHGRDEVSRIKSQLTDSFALLKNDSNSNTVITKLSTCYDRLIEALNEIYNYETENMVDFSSKIKYTQLYMENEYIKMLNDL